MRAGGDRSVQKGYRTAEGLVVGNRVGGSSAAGAVVRARSVLCRVRSCCKPDTRKGHISVRACGVAGIVLQGELSDVLRKKLQTSAHAILRALSCSVHKACDPFVADGMAVGSGSSHCLNSTRDRDHAAPSISAPWTLAAPVLRPVHVLEDFLLHFTWSERVNHAAAAVHVDYCVARAFDPANPARARA